MRPDGYIAWVGGSSDHREWLTVLRRWLGDEVFFGGVREHVAVDEITGELPDGLLLGGEREIHGS